MESVLANIWFFSKDDNICNKVQKYGTLQELKEYAEKLMKEDKDIYADFCIETHTTKNKIQ